MTLNNKGFAISSIMYIILLVCIILITVTLSILSNRKLILDKQKSEVSKNIYNELTENVPNSPELIDDLIPVVYNGETWIVADDEDVWYDYKNQEWANAILLNSGVSKKVGDIVDVNSEVQGMFVWIPRYEYKIEGQYGKGGTSATSPGEIEVKFITKSKTTVDSGYIVHPAFTFGDKTLSGIWVGKFETSADQMSTCYITPNVDNCNVTTITPYILPNVNSLTYQQISTQFALAKKFNVANMDSHMMKNSEWGAVAYLSQSKYGKYGNPDYIETAKEVTINTSLKTGGGNYTSNIVQSTTGNITGVYDMSGGAWEYVMGNLNDSIGNSGFISLPESKYYDKYTSESMPISCNNGICYGHALNETANWYGDYDLFVSSSYLWTVRGGSYNYGTSAGVFSSVRDNGGSSENGSFRVVLSSTSR